MNYRITEAGYLIIEWAAKMDDALTYRNVPQSFFWGKVHEGADPSIAVEGSGSIIYGFCEK